MIKIFGLLSLLFILGACSRPTIYDTFDELFEWSDIEQLGFNETIDFVYFFNRDFFGTECPGCQIVRDELQQWFQENDDYDLYLINERVVSGLRPVGIRSAPTLILIYQGQIVHRLLGAGPILDFLIQMDEDPEFIQTFLQIEED